MYTEVDIHSVSSIPVNYLTDFMPEEENGEDGMGWR